MRWEEALAAVNRIEARNTIAAYTLGYRYLTGGPALLSEREHVLRWTVFLIPEGEDLPIDLGRDLFAWMTATSIVQRRLPWDLPPFWADPESASG